MRLFVLSALAITAFVATMVIDRTDANAVVYCARGVYQPVVWYDRGVLWSCIPTSIRTRIPTHVAIIIEREP